MERRPRTMLRRAAAAILLLAAACFAPVYPPVDVSAETSVQVVLAPSATTVSPGDTLLVEVRLLDAPDLGAIGPITIQLDPERLGTPAIALGPMVPAGLSSTTKGGKLGLTFADPSGNGTKPIPQGVDVLLCTLSFPVLPGAAGGASSLSLLGVSGAALSDGTEVASSIVESAVVSVQLPPTATPEPTPTPTPGEGTPTAGSTDGASPTSAPTAAATPTAGPAPGPSQPAWLLPAFLVATGVALIEFLMLLSRSGSGSGRGGGRSAGRRR